MLLNAAGGIEKMFLIMGRYHGKTEELDRSETLEDARYLKQEYQIAFGPEWDIQVKEQK
jgi:hypothetical protein